MTSIADSVAPTADPRRWKALAVLALVQFMLILDVTVVNVALPNIQKDLHFGPTGLAWVVDGYVLMAGGLLLLGGRLSDIIGRKRLFLIGVAVFGISSITCGLAQNPAMLVTSRFIQGTGEAWPRRLPSDSSPCCSPIRRSAPRRWGSGEASRGSEARWARSSPASSSTSAPAAGAGSS